MAAGTPPLGTGTPPPFGAGSPPPFGGGPAPSGGYPPGGGPVPGPGTIPNKEATEALILAIVGLFCCGVILGPIAIYKGLNAKKMIQANPQLSGNGKATAAIVIGVICLIEWLLGIIARLMTLGHH